MIPTNDENYEVELYKRNPNSPYTYQTTPDLTFKARPASQMEKKVYRIIKGVNGGSDSTFLVSSNLPKEVADGDRVRFLGKIWTVQSTGYYFDQARIINASCLSENQIINRCPKGLNIQ